jgi:hypothetical protein
MLKIRNLLFILGMLLCTAASAEVHVSIGINLPVYPQLVVVPGYPVYYAPQLEENYFFYDGMYWVYQDDNWYESTWYNGPWWLVRPEVVPVFILRIPVRYYRRPPVYFHAWLSDAPPRWGEHWGHDWEQHRSGWDRWDRRSAPRAAPLPTYQRQYSGDNYPKQVERQHELQQQKYRYQPRDPVVRQQYQEQAVQRGPAQQENQGDRGSRPQGMQRAEPRQQDNQPGQRSQAPRRGGEDAMRPAPPTPDQGRPDMRDHTRSPQTGGAPREQTMPESPARQERQGPSGDRGSMQQDMQRSSPRQHDAPAPMMQRRPEVQDRMQQSQPGAVPREQPMPKAQSRQENKPGKDATSDSKPGQERGRDHNE